MTDAESPLDRRHSVIHNFSTLHCLCNTPLLCYSLRFAIFFFLIPLVFSFFVLCFYRISHFHRLPHLFSCLTSSSSLTIMWSTLYECLVLTYFTLILIFHHFPKECSPFSPFFLPTQKFSYLPSSFPSSDRSFLAVSFPFRLASCHFVPPSFSLFSLSSLLIYFILIVVEHRNCTLGGQAAHVF